MKELLTYIARNLVEQPDQVSVNEIDCDGEIVLELRVAPEDMARSLAVRAGLRKKSVLWFVPWPSGRTPEFPLRFWIKRLPYQELRVTRILVRQFFSSEEK